MSPADKVKYKNMAVFGFGPLVMKSTKICTYCGLMINAREKTCPECKIKLPRETLFDRCKRSHKSCESCDTVLAEDSNYCPNCGSPVSKGAYEK
jgi:RNA polymerase subunit RPABC4/transcription elongation factor Spt4